MRAARSLVVSTAIGALAAIGACSADVVPAPGRVVVLPRFEGSGALAFGADYTGASLTVVGLEDQRRSANKALEAIVWTVEGGRYGNTKEYVAVVAVQKGTAIVTAKKVRFVVPWSGAKRLEVRLPKDCGASVGSSACDVDALPAEWVDATMLDDYVPPP